MNLTIYIPISSPSQNLTWETIHKADEVGGMIEQPLSDLIEWHSLEDSKLKLALSLIKETWGHIKVIVNEEIILGTCYCTTKVIDEIML